MVVGEVEVEVEGRSVNVAVGSNVVFFVVVAALQEREESGAPMIMLIAVSAMRKSVSVRAAKWLGSLLSK